jgi:glutamate carboxypeptidase
MVSPALLFLALAAAPAEVPVKPLDATERRIARFVTDHADDAVDLLQRTTDVNSGTLNPEGVRTVGAIYEKELAALGFRTSWVEPVAGSGRGPHLFAEREGKGGRRVLLVGHLDTVFEPASPFQRFERTGATAKGPGTVDMKGGNAIIVQALRALADAGALDGSTIRVALLGDEEDPGPLPQSRVAFREIAARSDVALGFEATAEGLESATVARRGATTWRLRVRGPGGHSSGVFNESSGPGAAFEAARILSAFHDELRGEPALTFSVGLLLGGSDVHVDETTVTGTASGKTNIIAGDVVALGDLRFVRAAQEASARQRMQAIVDHHLPKTTAELEFTAGYPAMEPKPGNYALLEVLDGISRALGQGPVVALDPAKRGAGDVSFIADQVDALDGLGAIGDGSHTVAEAIDLQALPALTQRAALLVYRLTR